MEGEKGFLKEQEPERIVEGVVDDVDNWWE
jgi:hypothetical protein